MGRGSSDRGGGGGGGGIMGSKDPTLRVGCLGLGGLGLDERRSTSPGGGGWTGEC